MEIVIGLPMALSLGLMYGLGPCLVSCLPFLGPVFLARDFVGRRAWQVVLPLALGRIVGYACFGLAAGAAGQYFREGTTASTTVALVVGTAAMMMGVSLLWRDRLACAAAGASTSPHVLHRLNRVAEPRFLLPGGLFLMGIGMALTPCAPLGVVLFSAAATGQASAGGLLGLGFGLGAVAVPSLVYGLGVSYFGVRLRTQLGAWRPRIERLSAGLLILVGASQVFRGFQ
jgi:thiol:disulfide interchange protein DsbD